MPVITTYAAFSRSEGQLQKLRSLLRRSVLFARSRAKRIDGTSNWIRFPYYHHVFDDEVRGFGRQLKYMGNYGDFISMDQAHEMLTGKTKIDGRYFCVSFDDGFRSCYTNMMEITGGLRVPVMIYLPTDYIGLDANKEEDRAKIRAFHPRNPVVVPFLDWDECREMLAHNVSFGSHTCSHARLIQLDPAATEDELRRSKALIEAELGRACDHFAYPWGRTGLDFGPSITTAIGGRVGFKTMATTNRGKMQAGGDPALLRRDHLLANWENFQLRYFMSL